MKKRCMTMLFVMLLMVCVLTVPAFAAEETSGSCGKDVIWSYDQELQLLSIFGSGSVYDYGEGLAPWAEWADEISRVQISDGIYTIGQNAFYGCRSLYSVDYLGDLEQWMSIDFRDGNEQLGGCVIACRDWVPDKEARFGGFNGIEGNAFWMLDGQGNLTIYGKGSISRNSICGPANAVDIPWAWWRKEIITVTVKEGITTTSYELFADCVNLKRAVLPDTLRVLDASTFSDCISLEEVEMPNYQGGFTLGSGAFLDCASLKSIELPLYTKEIDDITFQGCSALEEIVIPEGVKTIGSFAFFNCASLKTVYLPASLERIKMAVNINHYGESPFTGCTSLVNFVIPEGSKYAVDERGVLFDKEQGYLIYAPDSLSGSYTIPDDVNYVWAGAFKNCVNLTEITIPDSVTGMHNEVFCNCTSLKEVTIPNSVVEFGYEVFLNCTALERVTLSERITSLDSVFQGCTALRSVKIPDSVTELGYKTFSGCTALEKVEMSENTQSIGKYCFENCANLTEVYIPEAVTAIGESAFHGCDGLIAVDYAGFESQWEEISIAEGNEPLLAAKLNLRSCENHDIVIVEAVAPTCTADGNTEGRSCSVCGKVLAEREVLPMLPHTYENGVCTVCGSAEPEKPAESPFTDVRTTDWFFAPVLWAKETGVTGGKTATTFAPGESCTRAQVVTFLWAANGKPAPKTTSNPFTDVPNNAWYLQPVLWAVENGVTGGTSPTTFGPDHYCTRAQVVTFLYAAAGKPEVNADSTFEDVADTDWFAKPVIWAKENNVTGGISPTQFGPNNVCTRAQVVTFLYSSKDNVADTPDVPDTPDTPDVPDVPEKPIGDHEAYGAVRHELWQPAANTPLNQLPRFDDTATYEGIQQILDTCDPDGALMFRYNPKGAFGWVSPFAGMTEETDTAIHETYHGFSHTTTYYLEDGYCLGVPGTNIYLSEEMTVLIPAENRTFRFTDYVGIGSNLSSNVRGIYGLMNEFNAYQMGMNYNVNMFDYYCAQESTFASWSEYINGCENNRQAYAEFRYYILTYLLYAKEHYPAIYEGLMNNEKLRYAFTVVESNFAEDIAQYEADLNRLAKDEIPGTGKIRVEEDTVWVGNRGTGRYTAEYKKLMTAMSAPAYVEMLETFTLK